MAVKQLGVDNVGISQPRFVLARFNPLRFAPSLWLDAADLSTIVESSGFVSQWNDKSGNGRNFTQSSAGAQPVTGTRTQNGLNGIDFDGSDDQLARLTTSLVNQSDGTFTAFAVVVPDVVTNLRQILNGDPGSGLRAPQFLRTNTSTLESIRITKFDGTNAVATASKTLAFTAGSAALVSSTLTDSTITVSSNNNFGTPVSATGGATTNATTIRISAFFDGLICEILAFPAALSSIQFDTVQDYLRAKWGVY